jgi:hypothetical protein
MTVIKRINAKADSDAYKEALQVHKSMKLLYDNTTENYRYECRNLKTTKQFAPYIESINQITKIGLDTQDAGMIARANSLLNDMECEFVKLKTTNKSFSLPSGMRIARLTNL